MGNYKPEALIVTGQIRTDIIPYLTHRELPKKGFTIVYASQPQRDAILREKTAIDIFKAVKTIPECNLTVKLHPNERYDIAYYQNLANQVGITNIEILANAELYIILSECDAAITSFSTVGTEIIYFNKPLIIYDPLKQDLQKYKEEGVALQATNSSEVQSYLQKIKDGEITYSEQEYKKFIKYNAFKIDGKVSERCIDFYKKIEG